jgi:hypothetical protein
MLLSVGKGPVFSFFFSDLIKLKVLRWEVILDYPTGPDISTVVFVSGKQRRGQCENESRDRIGIL